MYTRYQLDIEFCEPLLGGAPLNKQLYSDYIASKAPSTEEGEEEVDSVPEEKGSTGFHRDGDTPFIYDYVIKGFFKDACSMLRRVGGSQSKKLTAYKKIIDGLLFVYPRRIPLQFDGDIELFERPVRAQTPQGERVALMRSEMVNNCRMRIELVVLDDKAVTEDTLKEWLDYGAMRGLGQFRNGSYGRFDYTLVRQK